MMHIETEVYREIELLVNGVKVGHAEISEKEKMLATLEIFEPYQGKGYGTKAVKALTEKYGLTNLWVRADNAKAIHVYEKCGYKILKPTMYLMEVDKQNV